MGAFAGYGLKAYLVCQSLNHVTRPYGRDSVIIDNCRVVTAFAAADIETAKTIAAMTGERWEIVEQESVARPRRLLTRRGATSFREERRPLMLPSDVRQLPDDEEIIFVAGAEPIRAKKLRFDEEPMLRERLRPATWSASRLTTAHDWVGVRPLGQSSKERRGARRGTSQDVAQGDLFRDRKTSEQAPAGFASSIRAGIPRGLGV